MNDTVRDAIRNGLGARKRSMRWLSQQLGHNPSYIQQFLERGSPTELDLRDILESARLLDMPIQQFGVSDVAVRPNGTAPQRGGMAEDAVEFAPQFGSILAPQENVSFYRMTSNALENHPLRIVEGDVLAFDMSKAAVESLKSEQVVILRCYHPDTEKLAGSTMVREYIRPGLITTNRMRNNEVFAIDDPSLPFEAVIRGVLRSVVRNP